MKPSFFCLRDKPTRRCVRRELSDVEASAELLDAVQRRVNLLDGSGELDEDARRNQTVEQFVGRQ